MLSTVKGVKWVQAKRLSCTPCRMVVVHWLSQSLLSSIQLRLSVEFESTKPLAVHVEWLCALKKRKITLPGKNV